MGKIWNAIRAQFNKLANFFWTMDPIAQMQLEYDNAVAQLKDGRKGLEQYRGLVERVTRKVGQLEKIEQRLTDNINKKLNKNERKKE